jgi:serine/threonine-protein kinase
MPGQQPNQSLVGRTIQSADSTTPIAYKVTEWLRSSSVLDTYLAVHSAVGLKIELQVILPNLTAQSDFATRFVSQLKTLVALNIPSLAQVYDYGRDGGYFFIVIEHHKSPTLRVKLETDGPFPPLIVLNNARLIGETLAYASAQGVLHGLLAPEVVTLSSRRGPVLDHYGLTPLLGLLISRVVADDPQLGAYSAPELLSGQPVSITSDLYSLTALVYEMATGRQPYAGLTARQAATAPLPNPTQIDPALAWLIPLVRRGLAKDPAVRFASYAEFNAAVQEIIAAMEPAAPAKQPVAQVPITPPPTPAPEAVEAAADAQPVANSPTFVPSRANAPSPAPVPLAKTESVEEEAMGHTIADLPIASLANAATPLPKTEAVEEEDATGRTIADMPIASLAQASAPQAKTESVEDDAGGRTIADMPAFALPPSRPAPAAPPRAVPSAATPARPPAPQAQPKAIEDDPSKRTMLEMPGVVPSVPPIPPSFSSAPPANRPPAYPGAQQTIPRSVQERYRTDSISDDRAAAAQSPVQYNFNSVAPGGAQRSSPGQFNDRYGTRPMDRADLQGPGPSSGITGFISTPVAGTPIEKTRRSSGLLIVIGLLILLLVAGGVGFAVLHFVLHVF